MLTLSVPKSEFFDSEKNEFIYVKAQTLKLEHSLVSISKWEAKWKKPFLGKEEKTEEETLDYIRCMTLTQNVKPETYRGLGSSNLKLINAYIDDPQTATVLPKNKKPPSREIVTSELIYYWMVSLQIPIEFQKWHLNRLLTLIQVCNIKNTPGKKMSQGALMQRNAALNKARREAMNSKG